ncbi:MAG: hypothetical protein JXQ29_16440, partial [Planctomycetes bacterium]|nr:hypothetical protein [Planctomycetota bacterium]
MSWRRVALAIVFGGSLLVAVGGDPATQEVPQEKPREVPQDKPPAGTPPAAPPHKPPQEAPPKAVPPAAPAEKLVPLPITLPRPLFIGTPRNFRVGHLEKPLGKPRPPFLAPPGVKNVARGKPVRSSDEEPIIGELSFLVDGEKSGADGTYVDLTFGRQWVQIDLEAVHELFAIVVWHFHQ